MSVKTSFYLLSFLKQTLLHRLHSHSRCWTFFQSYDKYTFTVVIDALKSWSCSSFFPFIFQTNKHIDTDYANKKTKRSKRKWQNERKNENVCNIFSVSKSNDRQSLNVKSDWNRNSEKKFEDNVKLVRRVDRSFN